MLPSSLWQKELVETIGNPRSMIARLAFPLAVGGPYILAGQPGFYTATVVTVLAAFAGCFGAGIAMSKAHVEGMLPRIALTPLSPARIVLEQVAISSALSFCQILPLGALFAVRFGVSDAQLLALLLALFATTAAANLLGLVASLFANSSGEAMLYSLLALVPLLYLAGIFSPASDDVGIQSFVAAGVPFSYLQQALLAAVGDVPLWPSPLVAAISIATIAAIGVIAVALARPVMKLDS